jgi:hypothetical protein
MSADYSPGRRSWHIPRSTKASACRPSTGSRPAWRSLTGRTTSLPEVPGTARGPWASRRHYLTYAYHRYAIERESGFRDSANAVLEGLYDEVLGRWGPYSPRPRPGLALLRAAFGTLWRVAGDRGPAAPVSVESVQATGPAPPVSDSVRLRHARPG